MQLRLTRSIFYVFLFYRASGEETSTLISSIDIIKKGRQCVEVAESAIEAANQNDVDIAIAHLQSLQADGEYLAKHAQAKINLLNVNNNELHKQLDRVELQIGDYGQKENDLKRQMRSTEVALQSELRTREDNERLVGEAGRELQRAEHKLSDAKDDARDKRRVGAAIGGVVGLLTGGLGAAVAGGVVGAAGAELINELKGDVDDAKDRVRSRGRALSNAEEAVRQTEKTTKNQEKQLAELSVEIESKILGRGKLHKEAKKIQKAIAFQMEAADLWDTFLQSTKGASDITEFLTRIVTKATERQYWNILRSDGTKLAEASFLEAWEEVEATAKETGSYYNMFLVE